MERWNDGMMKNANDGRWRTKLARALVLLSIIPSFHLSAQVGHDPAHSPYRDILLHSGPVFFVGHLSGNRGDRKSTRLNSSHLVISYAVFCLKKKKKNHILFRISEQKKVKNNQ